MVFVFVLYIVVNGIIMILMNHKTSSLHLSSLHPYFYIFIYFAQSSIIIIDDICLLIVIPKMIKKNDNPLFAISLYI